MGFPPAGAEIYRNEAGEPTGWSMPAEPDYCDEHGITFMGTECPACARSSRYEYSDEDDEYDANDEYDPGPEVDDEGGMSEYRNAVSCQWAKDWNSPEDTVYDDDPPFIGGMSEAEERLRERNAD